MPKTYPQSLADHYEKIIAETKCPKHKKLCKSVLKEIILPKLK